MVTIALQTHPDMVRKQVDKSLCISYTFNQTGNQKWHRLFANSQGVLSKLASEALQEHHYGQTQEPNLKETQ